MVIDDELAVVGTANIDNRSFRLNFEVIAAIYDTAFTAELAENLRATLDSHDSASVVAVLGVGTLFGLARISALIQQVAPSIAGRLVVFFPGERDGNSYRLLDARAGWNYLAIPISGKSE